MMRTILMEAFLIVGRYYVDSFCGSAIRGLNFVLLYNCWPAVEPDRRLWTHTHWT